MPMPKYICYTGHMKQIIGWMGVGLVLSAYILNMFDVIQASNLAYGVMNMLGAGGIIISSYTKKDFQPVVLNIVWLVVALVGIIRSLT